MNKSASTLDFITPLALLLTIVNSFIAQCFLTILQCVCIKLINVGIKSRMIIMVLEAVRKLYHAVFDDF